MYKYKFFGRGTNKINRLLFSVVVVDISRTQLQIYTTNLADFVVENTVGNSDIVLCYITHFQFSRKIRVTNLS